MPDPTTSIAELKKVAGIFEAYHATSFKCYRNKKAGGVQEVLVEILDAGSDNSQRYHCTATTDDGRSATGNPAPSIDVVLATLHWGDLDR